MTQPPRIPSVLFARRWWSADEIEAMASRWRAEIIAVIGNDARPLAAMIPGTPEGVALCVAMSSLPCPAILLAPDSRVPASGPLLPPGTRIVLPSSVSHAASAAERLGGVPSLLSDVRVSTRAGHDAPPMAILQSPGFVIFSSGSTGSPKPIFRSTHALLAGVSARLEALGLETGDGVIAGVSLAYGHGLTRLLSAMVLGGPFALLEPLDHRTALATLARPEFTCWSATAHFADVLGRCTLNGPAVAPRICLISSPISPRVFEAFRDRFNVPLRQNYSSSETGIIAVNAAPEAAVRRESVGRPVAGVEVRIGDHVTEPLPPGEIGRIWVRSPWQMSGYGFPPAVERPGDADGWWPTRDLGRLDADGQLALFGRVDDCIRTREGRLVDLAFVARSLRAADGVRDVAVVPFQSSAGASFGAVLECESSITVPTLKERLSDTLPQWAWPRILTIVEALPRLPNGKADRLSCSALLGGGS